MCITMKIAKSFKMGTSDVQVSDKEADEIARQIVSSVPPKEKVMEWLSSHLTPEEKSQIATFWTSSPLPTEEVLATSMEIW